MCRRRNPSRGGEGTGFLPLKPSPTKVNQQEVEPLRCNEFPQLLQIDSINVIIQRTFSQVQTDPRMKATLGIQLSAKPV